MYLDCDIVVTGDISKLWEIDLGENMIAGVVEGFIAGTKEFREYAQKAVGVDPDKYINAGILSINLDKFRLQVLMCLSDFTYLFNVICHNNQ